MKIYLVGFMTCGKSTLGKRLAKKLQYRFMDTDMLFEKKFKVSVVDFLTNHEEIEFRQAEQQIMMETAHESNVVIAVGGGCPCYENNMDWLLENGKVIYIKLPPKTLYQRLVNSKRKRPLLSRRDPNLLQKIIAMLQVREPYYRRAHEILTL
jgi:shikimate kinase